MRERLEKRQRGQIIADRAVSASVRTAKWLSKEKQYGLYLHWQKEQ